MAETKATLYNNFLQLKSKLKKNDVGRAMLLLKLEGNTSLPLPSF